MYANKLSFSVSLLTIFWDFYSYNYLFIAPAVTTGRPSGEYDTSRSSKKIFLCQTQSMLSIFWGNQIMLKLIFYYTKTTHRKTKMTSNIPNTYVSGNENISIWHVINWQTENNTVILRLTKDFELVITREEYSMNCLRIRNVTLVS